MSIDKLGSEHYDWFSCEEFQHPSSVFLIREKYCSAQTRCNIWFVRGSKADLLVDTGLGLASLWNFLLQAELISIRESNESHADAFENVFLEHPLYIVLTHIHFDHAGGAFEFSKVINGNLPRNVHLMVHVLESAALTTADPYHCLNFLRQSDVFRSPPNLWHVLQYPIYDYQFSFRKYRVLPAPEAETLEERDIIDIGDRQFRVLHLPGHSCGSIGLHCDRTGELFVGDAFYDGQLLDILTTSSIHDYRQSALRMLDIADSVDIVYPGHFELFSGTRLRIVAGEYLKLTDSRVSRCLKYGLFGIISCFFTLRSCQCYFCKRGCTAKCCKCRHSAELVMSDLSAVQ